MRKETGHSRCCYSLSLLGCDLVSSGVDGQPLSDGWFADGFGLHHAGSIVLWGYRGMLQLSSPVRICSFAPVLIAEERIGNAGLAEMEAPRNPGDGTAQWNIWVPLVARR